MICDNIGNRADTARHPDGNAEDRYLAYGKIAERIEGAIREGRKPDLEEIGRDHPELSAEFSELVSAMEALHDLRRSQASNCAGPPIKGRLGEFQLVREIGSGGMGVVYEALHVPLNRKVAVKILPLVSIMDDRQLQRFKTEVQATALLQHSNIVQVYSVGVEQGIHYFAMQYVQGQTLARFIAELQRSEAAVEETFTQGASTLFTDLSYRDSDSAQVDQCKELERGREANPVAALSPVCEMKRASHFRRVALMIAQAAEALDHAHDRGVLHRDIKPSNLMVDATGHLFVTDFGLARLETDTGITMSGDVLGTLRYMSPEQALAQHRSVDHRSDIYSLGATLYELLTLRPAFTGDKRGELLRRIAWEEPRAPRRVNRKIPRELEVIALKAMEKNPCDRYATAEEMAADLRLFADGKPIRAKRPTLLRQAAKLARRHQVAACAAVAVAVFALVALSISTIAISAALGETEKQQQNALEQRDAAVANLYLSHMRMAQQDWNAGQIRRMQKLLKGYVSGAGPDLRCWEWYYLNSLGRTDVATFYGHSDYVYSATWSPDGRRIASASADGTIKIWDVLSGNQLLTLRGHEGEVYQVAWSPKGDLIASGGADRTARIWNAISGDEIHKLDDHNNQVVSVAWTDDGQWLATAERLVMRVWNVNDAELLATHRSPRTIVSTRWRPAGQQLAWVTVWGDMAVWDVAKGDKEEMWRVARNGMKSLAWSPDGRKVATSNRYQKLWVWDLEKQQSVFDVEGHTGSINSVAWSPDGQRLASAGHDGKIKVWNATDENPLLTIRAHAGWVYSVCWSPDGQRLASGGADGTVKVWDATKQQGVRTLTDTRRPAWSPNGKLLACVRRADPSSADTRLIELLNANTYEIVHTMETSLEPTALAWDSKCQRLAVGGDNGAIEVSEAQTGRKLLTLNAHGGYFPTVRSLGWSPCGRFLASSSQDHSLKVWDTVTGKLQLSLWHDASVGTVAWSPDGKRIASASWDQVVKVWDFPSGQERFHLVRGRRRMWLGDGADGRYSLSWSPDGRQLAGGGIDGRIYVWDMLTGEELRYMEGHTSNVRCLAWGPDSRRIASGSNDRTVKIWNAENGTEVLTLRQAGGEIVSIAWSPDGRRLLAESAGSVHVWDAQPGYVDEK